MSDLPVTLSVEERKQLIGLLGELQNRLESAILPRLAPGTSEPKAQFKRQVQQDREQWKAAESFVAKLTRGEGKKAGTR